MSINIDYYMIFFLSILASYGIYVNGIANTLPQLLIAIIAASLLDISISYSKTKKFKMPYHAIILGIFVGTILPIGQNWYVPAIIAVIAASSKHLINVNHKHLFNPAMFGLFFVTLIFGQPLQWWGSVPLPLVLLFGLFISYKFKRFHLTLTYIITSIVLWSIFSLVTNNPVVEGIFFVNYYFVFFMLVEPMTSPTYKKGRILYGFLVAVLAFVFNIYATKFDPSNISLLTVNLFVPLINKYIRN